MPFKNATSVALVNRAPPDAGKGTERTLCSVGNELVRRGRQVYYICDKAFVGDRVGLPIEPLFDIVSTEFTKLGPMYHVSNRLFKGLGLGNIYLSTFALTPIIPTHNYRTVLGLHTLGPERRQHGISSLSFGKIEMRFMAVAASALYNRSRVVLHAENREQAQWITTNGFSRFQVAVIPPPLENPYLFADAKLWGEAHDFTLLFLGGLSERKGFPVFLEIMEKLEKQTTQMHFHYAIAGTGPLESVGKEVARSRQRTHFYSTVNEQDKNLLLNTCTLLISPSFEENYHLVIREAQTCGLPVLCNNLSGPRELVKRSKMGHLVENNNVDAYVQAVLQVEALWRTDRASYLNFRKQIANSAKEIGDGSIESHQIADLIEGISYPAWNTPDRRTSLEEAVIGKHR